MYWIRKRLLSQNFLINRKLVKRLIEGFGIGKQDTVLEIGPGEGIITRELTQVAGQVIAIELDFRLYKNLVQKLSLQKNLKLVQGNFLEYPLPRKPFKVFSNIPFRITADVIRKLLKAENPPLQSYLIVQKEAAEKFIIRPGSNTMAAVLYFPWWDIQIKHFFNRSDFFPRPKVDVVLIRIFPRSKPLILGNKNLWRDFVADNFIHNRGAKKIPVDEWLTLFNKLNYRKINKIQGTYNWLEKQQQALQKIHRTRTDKNWAKFRFHSLKV